VAGTLSVAFLLYLSPRTGGQAGIGKDAELKIEGSRPTASGFDVIVTIRNTGSKALILGAAAEGKGTLQSLDIQQWDDKLGWQSVGPCRDVAPISTLRLNPGESLQNIVPIGDRAHGWASTVCPRKIQHLGGRVRAILYFAYKSEEDFANRMSKRSPSGRVDWVSAPIELAASK
jgi:hypothetical protein